MINDCCGVICGNFGLRSHQGKLCDGAWHGKCFKQHTLDRYPVLARHDLENSLVDESTCEDDDPLRFKEARDGDHLMTPFQCVECHFVNIQGRLPDPSLQCDRLAEIAITRAILDSLWSRERSTVYANRLMGLKYVNELIDLGFGDSAYPLRGPWAKEDNWGMVVACAMLGRSTAPGKNAATVQYETVRKMRSHYSNFAHTCPDGLGSVFLSDSGSGSTVSFSKTNHMWFKRFGVGAHRRMGDDLRQDFPLTAPILRAAFVRLDMKWEAYKDDRGGRQSTALTACMLLATYYAALRGEEVVRVDLGQMLKHWEEAMNHEVQHVPLMLTGRFKQVIGEKLFCQPLAHVTKGGMEIAKWFERALTSYVVIGICTGPLFRTSKGKRATIGDLDLKFRGLLREVQTNYPNLIGDDVDLNNYSMHRSGRRGSTAEAQNSEIPSWVIEANNRWRKHFRSKGLTPGMSMLERYTEAKASVPALVKFSYNLRS